MTRVVASYYAVKCYDNTSIAFFRTLGFASVLGRGRGSMRAMWDLTIRVRGEVFSTYGARYDHDAGRWKPCACLPWRQVDASYSTEVNGASLEECTLALAARVDELVKARADAKR